MKHILFFFSIIFIFAACNSNKVYEKNIAIPNNVWNMDSSVKFSVPVEDISVPYNLFVNIRNGQYYPSSNLWLFITSHSPAGKSQRDTVECILADDKGQWLGSGMGDLWDNKIQFKKNIKFPVAGNYTIEMQHGMRMENLPMVVEIGLTIEKAEK